MSKIVLVPGVAGGVLLGLAFIALASIEGLGYGAREAVSIAGIALVTLVAQWIALQRANAQPEFRALAAFPPRYFTAMVTGGVVAVVYGAVLWFHFAVLDTTYLDRFFQEYLARVEAMAASPEAAADALAGAERMKDFVTDPFSQAMVQFGTVLMLALLTGLVAATVARKR